MSRLSSFSRLTLTWLLTRAILGWDLKSVVIIYKPNIVKHLNTYFHHLRSIGMDGATTAESLELLFSRPGVSATYSSLEWQRWYQEWVTIEVRMDTNLVSFDHFGWCLPSTILGIILTDTQIRSYSVSFLANQTSLAPISSGNKDCLFGFLGQ